MYLRKECRFIQQPRILARKVRRSEDLPTILHVHVHVALLGTVEAPIIATGDFVPGGGSRLYRQGRRLSSS